VVCVCPALSRAGRQGMERKSFKASPGKLAAIAKDLAAVRAPPRTHRTRTPSAEPLIPLPLHLKELGHPSNF